MQDKMCIEGYFSTIIYRNNNYTVAKFKTDEKAEKYLTVTGYIGEVYEDFPYRLYGDYTEHARYGMQFSVESYEQVMPNDDSSLIRYFSSAFFDGIGKKAASKIVAQLGKDAISILKEDPEIVYQLVGLSEKQKESLKSGIDNDIEDSVVFLTQHGISTKNILKIEATYEDEAVSVIKENPYQLVIDIDGIGFKTADKLAMSLGFDEMNPNRIKAAIVSVVLNVSMQTGNTFTSKEEVFRHLVKEFSFYDEELYETYLSQLEMERLVYLDGDALYHITQYDAEKGIADFLYGFPYIDVNTNELGDLDRIIDEVASEFNIEYDKKQVEAMKTFFDQPFSILTGGPGTGKTTIVRAIIQLYKELYPYSTIALCAPTGRAAKRLGELGGISATTIHSLLKWDLETNTFAVDENTPIEANLIIIDEFSMVDSWLFYNLLKAAHNVSRILIIGDENQLPSVGPGFVLKDLIESEQYALTRLEKIYRQSEGSDVISLAHAMKEGRLDGLHQGNDVKMFPCQNFQVKDQILKIVSNAFEKGYSDLDVQVLAPMYNGVAGIDALNKAMQELCNPPSNEKNELKLGYRLFREQDKILQLKNQPDDGVYNGDIGKIVEIVDAKNDFNNMARVVVDYDGVFVEYTGDLLQNITHAYCISIHKSQGSEYPIVVMPILKDYIYMLQRRLIYTGITRAKKSLVLLGSEEMLEKGIQRTEYHERKTGLLKRIKEYSEGIPF
ncbi:SF1B family DNA helicase RecD2 [Breznakia pachnodae]|uniref:ATP-dependent RecD2 DNA helicase n=1 Tax=Breznakia pachnodae TaxID=265178 RepID=A0ABU0E7Z5_9FIRM|nr:ATP-dependent RecD-like DNA helicase [Breznakia pachnodae]MDQ0362995.1 exodeoxyribonuclease V alpha subunit [Breznakia pachnodae]